MSTCRKKFGVPYLFLCAVLALWLVLSHIHLGQTSDSLIPVLVSLQEWTPFYWEQSRFGMLVPLLALPFRDPFTNLLVQRGLMIFAGLVAVGLLARFFVRSRAWFPIACASGMVFLVCWPQSLRCDYFLAQPYGVSFALGLGALLIIDRRRTWRRWTLALIMMVLAAWVNLAVGPSLALIIAARWAGQRFARTRRASLLLAAAAVACAAGFCFESLAPHRDPNLSRLLPLRRLPEACARLVDNALYLRGPGYGGALLSLAGAAALGLALARQRCRRLAVATLLAMALAAGLLLLMAARSRWTMMNDFRPRYVYMAMLLLQTGLVAVCVLALRNRLGARTRAWGPVLVSLALAAATATTYGWPSLATARSSLEPRRDTEIDALLAVGCTHIAGDYWRVWPAVYHANLRLHEQREMRRVWGVTFRCMPTSEHWKPAPGAACTVAILGHDAHAEHLLAHFFPPLQAESRSVLPGIEVRRSTLGVASGR